MAELQYSAVIRIGACRMCRMLFSSFDVIFMPRVCVCAVEWLSGWLAPVAKAKMNVSHEANREDGKIKQCFERILSCCRHNPKGERERKKCRTKKGGVCHNVSRYNL